MSGVVDKTYDSNIPVEDDSGSGKDRETLRKYFFEAGSRCDEIGTVHRDKKEYFRNESGSRRMNATNIFETDENSGSGALQRGKYRPSGERTALQKGD